MQPKFVLKRSAWSMGWKIFWGILGAVLLLIPTIFMIVDLVKLKSYTAKVFEDRIELEEGVFNKSRRTVFLKKVIAVDIKETLVGRNLNYGDIYVKGVGINYTLAGIKDAEKVYNYFKALVRKNEDLKQVVAE